jgi:hypothetical protein
MMDDRVPKTTGSVQTDLKQFGFRAAGQATLEETNE